MKFNQLKLFVAVYEEGSITAAAEREHSTQPGVSSHIKELEQSLDVQLFERSTAGVRATEAGDQFYQRARQILHDFGALEKDTKAFGQVLSGTANIGLMPAFTRSALAPAIEQFSQRYPQATLHITEAYSGELIERVRAGQLDFAIVPSAATSDKLIASHFASDREFFICARSQGIKAMQPVELTHIKPLHLIVPTAANSRRQSLEVFLRRHDIRPDRLLELDTMMATLDLISHGCWSAILPGILCHSDLVENGADSARSVHPIVEANLTLDYMLIRSAANKPSRASEHFLTLLQSTSVEIFKRIHAL